MKNVESNRMLVELHVPDFRLAETFYEGLGFERVWLREPEGSKGYLVLKKDNNILCFWPGNECVRNHAYFERFSKDTPRGYAVELVIMIDDLDNFYELAKSKANVVEEIKKQPWGLKDFRIEDPFGFYIRFTEPHDILDPEYAIK